MLRRYSSRNLETIPIQSKVLTIGTDNCDLQLNAKGVHPIHASIEQNPTSGSFWLRDHSLAGHTSVNGHTVNGQVELRNGDLVRIGRAQPYVFEKRSILPLMHSSVSGEESFLANGGFGDTMLPILGKHITPLPAQAKNPVRRPVTAVSKTRRTSSNVSKSAGRSAALREEVRTVSPPSSIETASECSTRSGLKQTIHNRGSVGNHLLQRVVRLQDEVARKNSEIEELRRNRCTCQDVPPSPIRHSYFHFARSPLPPVGNSYYGKNFELEAYRAFMGTVASKIRSFNNYMFKYPEEDSIHSILRNRNANYSDVFSTFFNITNEPFSQQMLEIERECDFELERKGFSAMQRTQLADFFRSDRKECISAVANEMELLVPIIRDACATAGESIRVCSVFTDWSRHLEEKLFTVRLTCLNARNCFFVDPINYGLAIQGELFGSHLNRDQIRVGGLTGTQLLQAIDQLKKDFTRNRMENHWLLPSISPLLALTAQELEKSRDGSSLGDTQTATDLADELFSKTNSKTQLNSEKKEGGRSPRSIGINGNAATESLDHILVDVEEKSAQLEDQLFVLERKISETKNINANTRERINQLLLRLNTSSCLIGRTCNGDSDDETNRKQSSASILSLEITEIDINQAKQTNFEKSAKEPIDVDKEGGLVKIDEKASPISHSLQTTDTPEITETDKSTANVHTSTENTELEDMHEEQAEETFQNITSKVAEEEPSLKDVQENKQFKEHELEHQPIQQGEAKNDVSEEETYPHGNQNGGKEEELQEISEEEAKNRRRRSVNSDVTLEDIEDRSNGETHPQNSEEEQDSHRGAHHESENEENEENEHFGSDLGKTTRYELNDIPETMENGEEDKNEEDIEKIAQKVEQAVNNLENIKNITENQSNNSARTIDKEENEFQGSHQESTNEKTVGDEMNISEVVENSGENGESVNEEVEKDTEQAELNKPNTLAQQQGVDKIHNNGEHQENLSGRQFIQSVENSINNAHEQVMEGEKNENAHSTRESDKTVEKNVQEYPSSFAQNGMTEENEEKKDGSEKQTPSESRNSLNGDVDDGELRSEKNTNAEQSSNDEVTQNNKFGLDLRNIAPSVDEDFSDSPLSLANLSKSGENPLAHIYDHDINDLDPKKHDRNGISEQKDTSITSKQLETLPSLGRIGVLPEFELTHKYHIQSHINTATRVPVISQPVPLQKNQFRSPPVRKKNPIESGKDTKPPLCQPRFVY